MAASSPNDNSNASVRNILTQIDFIANSARYEQEKPYYLHPSDSMKVEADDIKLTNVEWDRKTVTVHSMRDDPNISLERSGFCYVEHESKYLPRQDMRIDRVEKYSKEGEDLLRSLFKAEHVVCYDYKVRKNAPMTLEAYDPEDPLLVEQVAIGAHDITLDSVPRTLEHVLDEERLQIFSQPGYRFRLINTWRSILPTCKDRPLALCDYNSLDVNDLLATDRVYPTHVQEIYHLKYNKQQKWYWLPDQRSNEPFLFLTFDSHAGSNARYCPHISVNNPLAGYDAPPRESVETRNLVITRL